VQEGGFILPIVMIVLFLFTSFVLFQIEQMQLDTAFLNERHRFIQDNQIKKMAAADIIRKIQSSEDLTEGNLHYTQGSVKYSIENNQDVAQVTASLTVDKDHQGQLIFYYDKTKQKIIRWVQ